MKSSTHPVSYDWLLARARDPQDDLTRAFAGVIQAASKGAIQPPNPGMGLTRNKFGELLDCYFPGTSRELCGDSYRETRADCASLVSEFDDLLALLLEHRSNDTEHNEWLAYALASGCMGNNHLYEDMGLPDRHALSTLLQRYFTALYLKNVDNMKWKKFFYKQLCDRAEVTMCPVRSCQSCIDYSNCFEFEECAPELEMEEEAGR